MRFIVRILPAICAVLALGAILTALAVVVVSQRATARADAAKAQLDALYEVDSAASRYGRQAVDQLLFGYQRSGDLQGARNDMDSALAGLTRVTRDEMRALFSEAELQSELPEVEQVRRMIDLYHAIDAAATAAFKLSESGNAAGAREALRLNVDFRLTNELQPLIASSLSSESEEVRGLTAMREGWQDQALLIGAGGTALALLLAIVVLNRRQADLQHRLEAVAAVAAADLPPAAGGTTREPLARLEEDVGRLSATLRDERRIAAAEKDDAERTHERLMSLNEARSKLLADIGHQLRTPLTVLRGEADVAVRGQPATADLVAALTRIRAQAAELGRLLEDFIAAARHSGDSPAITKTATDLDAVVASAADEAAVLLDSRELSIVLDLGSAASVEGDFLYLKQAVIIGIDNAIKHSPPGGRIELATAAKGGQAIVRVADHGPGVRDEDRPHVFERFYRGAMEDELLNPGFGIGLSIARDIVDQHQGSVSLDNRPEGGAVFTITLPATGPTS